MTLVRAIGRTMLSSYFVFSGIRAVRNPEEFVADAEPVTGRLVPTAKRFAPDEVAGFIPEDTATLVRINGAVQVVGGLALATGKGRRLGASLLALSMVPTTLARHPFWKRTDPEQKIRDRQQFVKNIGLLGGVVIASRDTEGKPGLGWRANEGRELAAKRSKKLKKQAKQALQHSSSDAATAAIGSGLALVGGVVEEGRKARKQAAKRAKQAVAQAQKDAKKAQKQAQKSARKTVDKASKRAGSTAKSARKSIEKAAGEVRSQLGEHIELGQN